ncbi:MAG TPA: hypothetical protein VFJ70_05160 [Burkholderiales bacterium]|nr:hypothetical protein [Burkholderiales bacterium]
MNATRTTAWQCIGCGRLESDATCLGICQDRKVVVVSAADYDEARRQVDELRLFVRQLALTSARGNEWERTYKALQERARRLLATLDGDQAPAARAA